MTIHFLDTSAWAKLYVAEAGSSWAAAWYAEDPTVAVSSLGLVELLSTLARRHEDGTLTRARFIALYKDALDDASRHTMVHLRSEVLELAASLPLQVALRGADTVQLASLLILRTIAEDEEVVLVGSDRSLNQHASAHGVRVIDPAEEER